ncbi:MAG: gamma-butyrobetaine dioxygenase [Homavirus sp.]|uniref:Gamma-butyrobetaine dioxygenase n=1 Tax=Homavirus sp. TaxID=2487769 RepID=A0A3G5AA67_9VIRU|nr:MAG: gamma-butyrobetaine dioxygenase [Homavirus sp.]
MATTFIDKNGLKLVGIQFNNTTWYAYHTMWLRHNCRCEQQCLHNTTKELIVCSSSLTNEQITVQNTHIDDTNLYITWMDNHNSVYNLGWLLEYTHTATSNKDVMASNLNVAPDLSCLDWTLTEIDDDNEKIKKMMQLVDQHGYCYIKNFGLDNQKFIQLLDQNNYPLFESHFGIYENLQPAKYNTFNKHTDQLGYTYDRVDLHTDQPFIENCPPYQSLHCICKADVGGSNMIVDIRKIYKTMKELYPHDAHLLATQPILFDRKQKDFRKQLSTPIITLDENGEFKSVRSSYFTIAPFDLPFDQMIPYYTAYNRFHELVRREEAQIDIHLEPGELIVYNNHIMMHARTAFSGKRLMKGTYHMKIIK